MHLELVDYLRCPRPHAPGVLVAAADLIANRYVTEGTLGCPECLAEFSITGGITHFADAATAPNSQSTSTADDEGAPLRLAAQLSASAGHSTFAVVGYALTTVVAMRELVPARVIVFNAPQLDAVAFPTERLQNAMLVAPIGVAHCGIELPLAESKFDGIALHAADDPLVHRAAASLKTKGRLVAPVSCRLPTGFQELARDQQVWVAERESTTSKPIGLTRR
ncbi:MAG: hypothetical protein ACO1Q7_09285 [Gemmatimonas sp.]